MPFPRLRQLVIASETTDTIDTLKTVFGLDAPFPDPGVAEFGLVNGVFAIGDQFLEVVVPTVETAPAARFMARGGPGGYMAIFEVEDLAATRARVDTLGIRRVWDIDLEDIAASHLHPADLGGAIVSVDQPKPAGEWRWGGPDWRRRSTVGRLIGAELTSPDPIRLMARWASALGAEGSGNALKMDDGDIVFSQGDVERLVAFDLSLPDGEAVLARAREAGLDVDGRSVRVAGVEMRLA
ncbi:hypothetical protein [Hyphomonas chukchiensis]|uniref:Glyoxalase-like domain-containing protein n=1 Tax=Hyphomonas chukchiensis TaxID=1280947 RepID=A0A062UKS3_9PROT|nr:hypothetical protein [Hyphomonas chukchiensis]KCZ60166.1 hypothetical protein HY30_11905 [Hyphomonas chukchiensis]